MKTIAALVDFSELSAEVLNQARKLATAFSSKVILIHVVEKEPVVVDLGIVSPVLRREPSAESLQKHQARLVEMNESLLQAGVDTTFRQLENAGASEVLAALGKENADLIILGLRPHGAIHDLFIGGMSTGILKNAGCPVLVVPGR